MRTTVQRRLIGAVVAAVSVITGAPAHAETRRDAYSKVMIIVEENRTADEIFAGSQAPYLTGLARDYGSAANMLANYPTECPSLAAYILMTSGTTGGICDDEGPRRHSLSVPNIFAQLDAAHRRWRNYAENLPAPCARTNSADGMFLVRHTAVPYYTSEAQTCSTGQVELGTPDAGALSHDLRTGRLPAYSFVTPNACHDMHGATGCPPGRITTGDSWLSQWIPRILAGQDYRAGRLVVIITWDEGSVHDNHIPTVVISPTTRGVVATQPYDHCSTLRTSEDLLGLSPLGCARSATSMVSGFRL